MPFTPFHMGAGLIAKAATNKKFSLVSFGLAQIFMDIEPGVRMWLGDEKLHGWSHTLWGALCIGLLTVPLSRPLINVVVNKWNAECRHYGLQKWKQPVSIGWKYAVAGALFGTLSHLLLDSLMHADMSPFFPFTKINPLLGLMQHDAVYAAMVVCGIAGALIWWLRQLKMK